MPHVQLVVFFVQQFDAHRSVTTFVSGPVEVSHLLNSKQPDGTVAKLVSWASQSTTEDATAPSKVFKPTFNDSRNTDLRYITHHL